MPVRSYEYCSLHYLNLWFMQDSICCKPFKNGSHDEKLEALQKAAAFYRISRNLPLSGDEAKGLPRFKPLLDVIDTVKRDDFRSDPVAGIHKVEAAISKRYGGKGVLSLTTKVLWLKLKRPVIIYDAQARSAIGTRAGDLKGFYNDWRKEFQRHSHEIARVCAKLEKMGVYSVNGPRATPNLIHKVASTRWFHERVFDVYLWNKGIDG